MDSSSPHNRPSGGGPLSRTWPQLFKKRRRHSPVGESIMSNSSSDISGAATPPLQRVPIPKTGSISAASGDTASTMSSVSGMSGGNTQADLLASKSNYEWIAEGRHAEMGLHFSTAMATGVMMKRATHRAAEQARRDRMKTAMIDLAEFLLDGEVTFGSGTTCFVVMRGEPDENGEKAEGKKSTINKARLIEMALEKMKAQEKEIEVLRAQLEKCSCRMDAISTATPMQVDTNMTD